MSNENRRIIEVEESMLEDNERRAEVNRDLFRKHSVLVLNVLSSPGAGKTEFLAKTMERLRAATMKGAVIVGDLATDNDAQRLRAAGAPAVQITTGTMCHLEAGMIAVALKQLDLAALEVLIIENVGNLVCPASFDLGERLRVVLFSVTEGEDKPLKYPPMFQSAQVVVVSKMDLAGPCGFNRELALKNLAHAAPRAKIFEVSARTGQGMAEWINCLRAEHDLTKAGRP